ncbi:hypothetical protein DB347_21820 [Opitutaceae bacterium EW11]|nr:hypothetical protein DB347_21820 [Opitutaceae bacterium EW11]
MAIQFSFRLPEDREAYIAQRAEALGMEGPTTYVRRIIDQWFENGCPPVVPTEHPGYKPQAFIEAQPKKKRGRVERPAIDDVSSHEHSRNR